MFARKFDLKLMLVAAIGLALAACSGRARRPITQPAPPAGQNSSATGVSVNPFPGEQINPANLPTDNGDGTADGLSSGTDEQSPDSDGGPSTGSDTSVITGTGTGTDTATSTSTSTSTSTGNQLIIPLNTEDNTTIQFEWDGQSFKGNDKFDLNRKP